MTVEDVINGMFDLKRSGRYVEDELVKFVDRSHSRIVRASKWTWREREVSTSSAADGTSTTLTLPLNSASLVDVNGIMWVKDYDNKRELWPVDVEPFSPTGDLPQYYRVSEDGLSLILYPARTAIADLRYKYWRKIYPLKDLADDLLIPDEFEDVVTHLALSYAFRGIDDSRATEFEGLAGAGISAMKVNKFGTENARTFIQPDPMTQTIGSRIRGFDVSGHN